MNLTEPLSNCRRMALGILAAAMLCLAIAWPGHAWWHFSDFVTGVLVGIGLAGPFGAALLWFTPDMSDAAPRHVRLRYSREVAIVMSLYVGVMLVWKRLLGSVDATWLRVVVALLPALLVCWVLRAFVIYVRDSDEMQRRIELESGAFAALLMSAGYLAAGFLQSAELIAVPAGAAMMGVFPALCLLYVLTKIFVARRYL